MLVHSKKYFSWGLILTCIFFGVLAYMFSPSFTGAHGEKVNAFHASDNLFNSIAKGSTNYFTRLRDGNTAWKGHVINLTLHLETEEWARQGALILQESGVTARVQDTSVVITGDLHNLINQAIKDAEDLFENRNKALEIRYCMTGKHVLFIWWKLCKALDVELKHIKDFKAASFVSEVMKRGIEVGYNFYGIVPQNSTSKVGMLVFSLTFYVIYTLLWGFAIFYLFEGIGLEMSSGNKKEV